MQQNLTIHERILTIHWYKIEFSKKYVLGHELYAFDLISSLTCMLFQPCYLNKSEFKIEKNVYNTPKRTSYLCSFFVITTVAMAFVVYEKVKLTDVRLFIHSFIFGLSSPMQPQSVLIVWHRMWCMKKKRMRNSRWQACEMWWMKHLYSQMKLLQ